MSYHPNVYQIVKSIPEGKVMSYGQIAELLPKVTARMVGYALSALPEENDVPWWRVVNSQLKISLRSEGGHDSLQKVLLMQEGVVFSASGKMDAHYRL